MSVISTKIFKGLTVNDALKEFTKWLDRNKEIEMILYSKYPEKFKQVQLRVLYKEIE